jgi:hypothetical protein
MAKLWSHPDVGSHTLRGRTKRRGSRRVREKEEQDRKCNDTYILSLLALSKKL